MKFDSELFNEWLDDAAGIAMQKVSKKEDLSQQEMMILILKAQTNRIVHLESAIHAEGMEARRESNARFEEVHRSFEEANRRSEEKHRESDRHFEEMQRESKARFEEAHRRNEEKRRESDRHFEEMQRESKARFEEANRRNEEKQRESDRSFAEKLRESDRRFEDLTWKFGLMQWLIVMGVFIVIFFTVILRITRLIAT